MTGENLATSAAEWPSLRERRPLDEGGPIARSGFNYQDEIAVGFFIEMLESDSLAEICCETHDDIVLLRTLGASHGQQAEFVQVKSNALDKLWSVADLCERKKGSKGTSIFEISLARDQYAEESKFRLVTLRDVNNVLEVLTFPIGANGRQPGSERMKALAAELEARCPATTSAKGNGHPYWLQNCTWDVRHDERTVCNDNMRRLLILSSQEARGLLPDTAETLLLELRAWAKDAGAAKWEPDRSKKSISRQQLRAWWERRTQELASGISVASGGKLAAKMDAAGFPSDMVGLALAIRRRYGEFSRSSRYMESAETEELRGRVQSEVMMLRAQYASGALNVDGIDFHALLLGRMDAINRERREGSEDRAAFLQGCMYDIADRCLLQFARAQR